MFKTKASALIFATVLIVCARVNAVPAGHDDDWDLSVKEQETIRKSFPMTGAGPHKLEVDNVWGSIEVVGGASDQVQLVINQTIRAETKDRLAAAKKEVTLDISQDENVVKLYVNGPFRCQCQDCVSFREHPGYIVKMDFQLQVPINTEVHLRTVNEGHIKVQHVSGDYVVRNVNGGIEMEDIGGSGKVRTVNGGVKVRFRENPRESSEYASLNGNVELYFQRNLSGDFRFKTFNGGVYSDFEMTALPAHAPTEERRNGQFIFRADRYTGGRIGNGGPEIKVENFNGDIRILERHD